ncbi:MAG: M28 family peptidase [Candidatus Brocadiae bacterium]|nr:M28 family peptidase [Candidatus Brocadiia bacterium]
MRGAALLPVLLVLAGCRESAGPPARPGFDGDRSYALLLELCQMGPRNHGSPEKEHAEEWIQDRLKACGAEVSVHAFRHTPATATGPSSFRNIVGRWKPAEKRRILLGTHYDTRSWADRDPNPAKHVYPINGANDGGSGVAVLLALAEVFAKDPPAAGIDMIFFDGEDFGRPGVWDDYFLGSKAWVADHPDYTVEWGVILDMVGDANLEITREGHSMEKAPGTVDRVWAAAKRAGSDAFVEKRGATIMDDHSAFLRRGIPVILVIDFDYPWFHTGDDDPTKCSAVSLGQVGRAVLEAVRGEK